MVPYNHLEHDHDAVFVERAQEEDFELFKTLRGCVTCFNTVPPICNKGVVHKRDKAETYTKTNVGVAYVPQSRKAEDASLK